MLWPRFYGSVSTCVCVCVCVCVWFRALVGMMMYNNETKEIAKPSELLNGIKAMMNVLQSIENYGMWVTDDN